MPKTKGDENKPDEAQGEQEVVFDPPIWHSLPARSFRVG